MQPKVLDFFILPDEYHIPERYLSEHQILKSVLPLTDMSTHAPLPSADLEHCRRKALLFKTDEQPLYEPISSDLYRVDVDKNPVVELNYSRLYPSEQLLFRGRLYYTTTYHPDESDDMYINKSLSFLRWADDLFDWLRSALIPITDIEGYIGCYASPRVLKMVSGGELLLRG